jgi:nicotinamidase-related amidase
MKNRFTTTNAAMVLIDHQAGTINLARNISRAEVVRNMRALARTAVENGMPLVLTTSLETEFQGPMLDDLKAIARRPTTSASGVTAWSTAGTTRISKMLLWQLAGRN